MDAALSAIEDALDGCRQCGHPLGATGPSVDFCGEDCQHTWHQTGAVALPSVGGTAAPDESLPEITPLRPLGWLGTPPPGAVLREGHEVLDEVCGFLSRFSVFPDAHCAPTSPGSPGFMGLRRPTGTRAAVCGLFGRRSCSTLGRRSGMMTGWICRWLTMRRSAGPLGSSRRSRHTMVSVRYGSANTAASSW